MRKLFILVFILFSVFAKADYWTQKATFPGDALRAPFSFSIGNKGYVGCGEDEFGSLYNDFWEYDRLTNVWTQKASFGGAARELPTGFSIGNKGYAGLGTGIGLAIVYQDFWEYDPILNVWTQKANFGGGIRCGAIGFSIGSMGYVGTGSDNLIVGQFHNDLWQYNSVTDTWLQKTNVPGPLRCESSCFAIGSKGYIIGGENSALNLLNDLWEYNSVIDAWTQKANLPSYPRGDAAAFVICDKGYFGIGDTLAGFLHDLWQYNPSTNGWISKANFPGLNRDEAAFFSIGNRGYIGLGGNDDFPLYNDFWEYTPDSACATGIPTITSTENSPITISPNPFTITTTLQIPTELLKENCSLIIFDVIGKKVFQTVITKSNFEISRKGLVDGIYFYKIICKEKNLGSGKMVIE
ncbi:MAG: kelch repeat-containing protein [Bacteroidota bacterium]